MLHKSDALRLVVDSIVICSSIQTPLVAVALLFGSYFLLNIEYPKEGSDSSRCMKPKLVSHKSDLRVQEGS